MKRFNDDVSIDSAISISKTSNHVSQEMETVLRDTEDSFFPHSPNVISLKAFKFPLL